MRKVFIKTFGCQANFYDSARIEDLFVLNQYEITNNAREADVFVMNTCHIREKTGEKIFSELGKISNSGVSTRRARVLRYAKTNHINKRRHINEYQTIS